MEWKDIPGYEGLYQASKCGQIRSLKGRHGIGRVLRPGFNADGYPIISLCKNKKIKSGLVHRLVLLTFIGPSRLQTNHINGIKNDNRIQNLEYCTPSENVQHAYDNGLARAARGEKSGPAKLNSKQVKSIFKSNLSPQVLGKLYNISSTTVRDIKKKRTWLHITEFL